MPITYDPAKRLRTLSERGLDFEAAAAVFAGMTLRCGMIGGTMASQGFRLMASSANAW